MKYCFLFLVIYSSFQSVHLFIFRNFHTTLPPDTPERCKGRDRKWGFCEGNPPMRRTVDSCPSRRLLCDHAQVEATNFVKNFLNVRLSSGSQGGGGGLIMANQANIVPLNVLPAAGHAYKPNSIQSTAANGNVLQARAEPKRDILIMMDESGSVGMTRFNTKVKKIAAAIVKLLCRTADLHPSKTRVSVMTFDAVNHLHVRFSNQKVQLNTDKHYLAYYIMEKIQYSTSTDGRTCLNLALNYAQNTAFSRTYGARTTGNVVKEIYLITDGCANCMQESIRSTVNRLTSSGIDIYVIGVNLRSACRRMFEVLHQGDCRHHFHDLRNWNYQVPLFIKELEEAPKNGFCISQFIDTTKTC